MDKYERHMQICKELNATYKDKNTAYGDSVSKSFQKFGLIACVTRISDKYNRLEALTLGAENNVHDEKIEDTLRDMANYCIQTLIELEGGKE